MFSHHFTESGKKSVSQGDQPLDHGANAQSQHGEVEQANIGLEKFAHQSWLQRFLAWALVERNIRAVVAFEPPAQVEPSLDQPADLNLLVLLTDAEQYLVAPDWVERFGQPQAALKDINGFADTVGELYFLTRAGQRVHYVFLPVVAAYQMMVDTGIPPEMVHLLQSCRQILLEKDGLLKAMISLANLEKAGYRKKLSVKLVP